MKWKWMILLLSVHVLVYCQTDSTDWIVQKIMDEQKIVGLSLAVIKNGHPVLNKGYGMANVEHNVPVTAETVIRISSISKQFFCTAILKLQEEGRLSIEDAIHTFFPNAPEIWRPIRVKHLMSHTSGLKRESPAYNNSIIQPDIVIVESAFSLPLDFNPGNQYQYSNLGYFILAEIITRVSGMPWQNYIREKLFIPAGMYNSCMTDYYQIIPNRANGYIRREGILMNADALYAIRPSGGFLSTSTDMILWDKVLREKNTILKEENWEMLWQPVIKISNHPESKAYYGFGWNIDERNGHKVISHSGANTGFSSFYARFVDDDLSIIILTNTDQGNPGKLVNALAEYYLSDH